MSNSRVDILLELRNEGSRVLFSAYRRGIEEGLRQMAPTHLTPGHYLIDEYRHRLHVEIVKLDNKFNYQCPCSRFVDGRCERCGKPDPLASKKVGQHA